MNNVLLSVDATIVKCKLFPMRNEHSKIHVFTRVKIAARQTDRNANMRWRRALI